MRYLHHQQGRCGTTGDGRANGVRERRIRGEGSCGIGGDREIVGGREVAGIHLDIAWHSSDSMK